jgi:hypothetical protein
LSNLLNQKRQREKGGQRKRNKRSGGGRGVEEISKKRKQNKNLKFY